MLMVYFTIFTLCLASRISTLPAPAVCHVFRSHPNGHLLKYRPFTIRKNEYRLIKKVTLNMGMWTAVAIITKIQCGNLVLTAPFDHVKSIERNWEFHVQPDKIISVAPSLYVTNI
ncbi:unnamed protein product [Rotaria sp. Silwood2]|nr:unnamed protein product [Rotaria sp. Silwood2]